MAWCNALTEWYNAQSGTTYSCVYFTDSGHITPIRSVDDTGSVNVAPGSQDNPYVKPDAKGFRLVTKNEWELAARWRNDATNTVDGYSSPWFTRGNSASGATTFYDNNTGGSGEPGKSANDLVAVYNQYWDGAWVSTGVTDTAVVKSKVNGANSLGLYDMSGNLWEWCFDWCIPDQRRFIQGGSYFNIAEHLQVGFVGAQFPYEEFLNYGLRIARSAD